MNEDRHNTKETSQQVRDGEAVLRKIEQMREALYPQPTSGNRSKWEQYLPGPENSYHLASLSKDQPKIDQYRNSLQRKYYQQQQRLQRLFKQERDLMKQRHLGSSLAGSKSRSVFKGNTKEETKAELVTSSSVENMQRKIRQLQEKYKGQVERNKQKQRSKDSKANNHIFIQQNNKAIHQQASAEKPPRPKINSEMASSKQYHPQKQNQQTLSTQVDELRQAIQELKKSNQQILAKMAHRDQKKRHKRRSKEILLAILHKLEFINAEINTAKKGPYHNDATTKSQKHTLQLARQFDSLKQQYLKLDQERRKLELKQEQIEKKFSRFTQAH